MKFVHAADLHLDSPLRGLERYEGAPVARLRGATRRALEGLVGLCLEEGASFLVIAGDLYDGSWRDYSTGLFFAAQMSRLREADVPVFVVRGNHDAASQIAKSLRLPANVRELDAAAPVTDTKTLERLGVAVHGQSFATKAVTDDLAAAYPDAVADLFNVGLLHTCASGREGHERYAPCSLETLRSKGYDYWALGHVHAREVLSESPWIVFPGNLQGRHMREQGAKGATLVTVEGGRVARVEHRAIDVVRFGACEVDAGGAASADDVIDLARAAIERGVAAAEGRALAARVVLRGATRAHAALEAEPERWLAEIRAAANDVAGDAVWIERVDVETSARLDLAAIEGRDDALGQLARSLRSAADDAPALEGLLAELADLRARLPPEARDGDDGIRLDDAASLRDALGDVERMLVPRLLAREEPA